jgi:hypothetical protein
VELDRHAVRVRFHVPVRDVGDAGRVGEADRGWHRDTGPEVDGAAELRRVGGGLEFALSDDALGMVGALAGMLAEQALERVDELLCDRRLLGASAERCGRETQEGSDRQRDG